MYYEISDPNINDLKSPQESCGGDARGVNYCQLKQIYSFSDEGLQLIEVMKKQETFHYPFHYR